LNQKTTKVVLHYPWQLLSEVVKVLINSGADIESKDNDGRTPLAWASLAGNLAIVELLLGAGVDTQAKGNDGRTPLSRAAFLGKLEVVKVLTVAGAK
jgi:ankyrin repeat protein